MPELDAINKKYSFSSSGETLQENLERNNVTDRVRNQVANYGFKFPLKINKDGNGFDIHHSSSEAIADNLHHLILTNHGERVGNYYFGANLAPLLMEGSSIQDFESEVGRRIQTAIEKFMPYVEPQEFSINFIAEDDKPVQKVQINISYIIPLLGVQIRTKRITMYLGA